MARMNTNRRNAEPPCHMLRATIVSNEEDAMQEKAWKFGERQLADEIKDGMTRVSGRKNGV
jgi:hypothetical protein